MTLRSGQSKKRKQAPGRSSPLPHSRFQHPSADTPNFEVCMVRGGQQWVMSPSAQPGEINNSITYQSDNRFVHLANLENPYIEHEHDSSSLRNDR